MAHALLADASGSDGVFSAAEVEQALIGNRNYLGEAVLDDLLAMCQSQGATPVSVGSENVDISAGCSALSMWDGRMNKDSVAGHLFREFAFQFAKAPQWMNEFSVENPANTPSGFSANDISLQQFAQAILNVESAGLMLDATFGTVQFVERSLPTGVASGVKIPWAGTHNVEGGFNVFTSRTGNDGTMIPRHVYTPQNSDSILSKEAAGYHIGYGSSWMSVVSFTDDWSCSTWFANLFTITCNMVVSTQKTRLNYILSNLS